MNLKIVDGRCVTEAFATDPRMVRATQRLEGMKRWVAGPAYSFAATPFNLEVWRSVFPQAIIDGAKAMEDPAGAPAVAADGLFADAAPAAPYVPRYPPRDHQKRALAKWGYKPAFGLFMDIGTGKSWTAITMAGMRWVAGQSSFVLIIAKNGVHEQWIEEAIPQHISPDVPWRGMIMKTGTQKARREFQDLLAFDGLKVLAINTESIATKKVEGPLLEFLRAARGNATVMIDESQDIKTWNAQRTQAAIKYGRLARYRLIMTGTPISKSLLDLYSQFDFLDPDIVGMRFITTFKKRYCEFIDGDHGPQIVGHKNVEELSRKIDPFVFRITADEALDLPPQVYIPRRFELHDDQKRAMKELKQNFFFEFGNEKDEKVFVKNAASLLMRLQQISCGYLPKEDGTIITFPNPRMDALMDILDQRTDKLTIWCRFQYDVETVMARLGNQAVAYYGKTKKGEARSEAKRLFIEDRDVRYFVASAATAGTGLDGLQKVCKAAVYYSNSFDALDRWQSEGRTRRDGSSKTESATYFDLIAARSPDAKILANLRDKKSISDLTLDEYRRLLEYEALHETD